MSHDSSQVVAYIWHFALNAFAYVGSFGEQLLTAEGSGRSGGLAGCGGSSRSKGSSARGLGAAYQIRTPHLEVWQLLMCCLCSTTHDILLLHQTLGICAMHLELGQVSCSVSLCDMLLPHLTPHQTVNDVCLPSSGIVVSVRFGRYATF